MTFNQPIDQTDLIAGYKRASSVKPVKKEDIAKVLGEYGLKQGASGGQSDAVLQARAANAVVAWFKKQQAAKPAGTTPASPAKKPGTGGGTAPAKPGPAGAATSPFGTGRPQDTAKPATPAGSTAASGTGKTPPSSYMSPKFPAQAVAAAVKAAQPKAPPKPAQINAALTAAGLGATKPPAYALVSAEALNAWIARVRYNRNLLNQAGQGRVTNAATRAGF